jgi:hypothetical protein
MPAGFVDGLPDPRRRQRRGREGELGGGRHAASPALLRTNAGKIMLISS